MEIHLVTVVGAGTMGNGIAHTFALYGYPAVLNDFTSTQLNKAREIIHQNLERQHYKGTMHAEFGKEKYAPCILLRRLVVAGQLGRKTDLGFYDYRTDSKNPSVAPQFS